MNTWEELRQLRRAGMKPSLPVVVMVDDRRPSRLLAEEGCMVIQHKPGEVFPVELLEGLRVWLFLRSCGRAQAVQMLVGSRGVKAAELSSWCECSQSFERCPVRCEVSREWQ